ncbi:Isoflavone reductase-like protein A622 [Colletotrichum higginsianum]|uniref:Isoflavone reductase-like protein A622 n=1 Tax=Colletotrichum higginsianum TaxID=80884 RepID=A0A4T0WF96_9PEZI|nr:Isoflavone reductase-like protein A622 [Colletotrichum higginsianum]
MGVVAVAGGTGGFGKTVVEQLALSGKHDIVVFSRTAPAEQAKDGPKFISADYTNLDSLIKILESQNIDTVISTIGLHNEATEKAQLNLIEAAKRSSKTKRFIPSEFGAMNTPEFAKIEPYANVWLRAADALKASGLEYTRFINGFFLDYWGNEPLTVTYTVDVSRFIVRALDDKDWPEFSIVAGSDLTLNEALAKVEKVRGKKFNVTYDSEEKLKNNQSTVLLGYEGVAPDEAQWLDSMMGRMIIGGWLSMPKENRISEKHPDIIPLTVDELLAKYWGAKSN